MTKSKNEYVLDTYRMQLKHYFEKGLGELSDLSNDTVITANLVKIILDRYLELGGNLDFLDVDNDKYMDFLEDCRPC